jgi:hypothetical protein
MTSWLMLPGGLRLSQAVPCLAWFGMAQLLLLLWSTCLCVYSISSMMPRVLHGDRCLNALTGFGTRQVVAGSDIGTAAIAFSWMLLQSGILTCFGQKYLWSRSI